MNAEEAALVQWMPTKWDPALLLPRPWAEDEIDPSKRGTWGSIHCGDPVIAQYVAKTLNAASAVVVDDGEVSATPEGDGWRLTVQIDAEGNAVSHLLSAGDAAALSAALSSASAKPNDRSFLVRGRSDFLESFDATILVDPADWALTVPAVPAEPGVMRLLAEVDRYVLLGALSARSGVADAALDLAEQVGYQMGSATVDRILPECPTCHIAWPGPAEPGAEGVLTDSGATTQFMPLDVLMATWRPGSQDDTWTWTQESDQLWTEERGKMDVMASSIMDQGMREPVLLGHDGRVWDGHHRICVADTLALRSVPFEFAPSPTPDWHDHEGECPIYLAGAYPMPPTVPPAPAVPEERDEGATHKRSSMRLGGSADVWCRCGWKQEIVGLSGDDASRLLREAYDQHVLAARPAPVTAKRSIYQEAQEGFAAVMRGEDPDAPVPTCPHGCGPMRRMTGGMYECWSDHK